MPKANPSGRSSGKVNLSFGVINIPTTLYSGTVSDHGVTRHTFVVTEEGDHPVGKCDYDKATNERLEPGAEIVRKIETEYGHVFVEDHEIETLFSLARDTLIVKEFEPQHNFHQGHFVPSGLMYVEPTKTGTGKKKGYDPIATKILATLFGAMRSQNAMAVCELTTRGKPKPCVLMPDGRLWLVYHTDATREQRELPEVDLNEAEVQMMGTLIKTLWADQPLDFTDERSALIQGFADEKAEAGDFDKSEEEEGRAVPAPSVGPDLMAMLAASVEKAEAERKAV